MDTGTSTRRFSTSRCTLSRRRSAGLAAIALTFPLCVHAHAFGQRYDLPLPLSLYLWSAGSVVLLSFLIAIVFMRVPPDGTRVLQWNLENRFAGRVLTSTPVRRSGEAVSLFLFVLVIVTGLFGVPGTAKNFAPIFVWVIWWVGMAYVAAFFGNLWDLVNPWRIAFSLLQRAVPSLGSPQFIYPERLGVWPALILFLAFAWLEFVSGVAQQPHTLAVITLLYSSITLAGMFAFGGEIWLCRGEAFTVAFGLIARFGLFRGDGHAHPRLLIRLPGSGLLDTQPVSPSMMAFVILMLTTVSFDGFLETPLWASIQQWLVQTLAPQQGGDLSKPITTLALLMFYGLFVAVYIAFSALIARLFGPGENTIETARVYVLSLVPIAIAYHLAHYLSYLLIAGQLMIPIASDPFGFGWNLFGSAGYRVDIGVIGAKQVWYLAVSAIVAGHIAAVCIAHATALRRSGDHKRAIVSQLPMLVLMVAYTMISLWILSQPIVAH